MMCPSVRPSVCPDSISCCTKSQMQNCTHRTRLFSEQREYRSTIRKSLRRLAKGRRRRLDPERPTYLPCQTAGPCTHPRGAAPTSLSKRLTLSFPSTTFLGHKTHTMAPSADGAPPVSIAISHELLDQLPPNSRRSQPIKPLTSGYSLDAADGH